MGRDGEPEAGAAGEASSSPDLVEESTGLLRQGFSRLMDLRLWACSDAQARDLVDVTSQLVAQAQAPYRTWVTPWPTGRPPELTWTSQRKPCTGSPDGS